MYDAIIVGTGIAGASVAYELSGRLRICLVEAETVTGYHTTGRSAALFVPSYGGREIRAVTRASRSFFDSPPSGFCESRLLRERGCLYIARQDQRVELSRMMKEIGASGGMIDLISPADALAQVPLLRESYVAAAAFDGDAMDIDVNALHQGFLRGARANGAVLKIGSRVCRGQSSDGVWHLEMEGGETVAAPIVVNAAGAWADQVAEICGARRIGLEPLRRTALLVDVPPGVDIRCWPAVVDADEKFYFKPDAGKLLLSPADETPDVPRDVSPEELDLAIAVDRIQAALNLDVRRISHSWAGLRTFSPDRVPVIGYDPDLAGFFWCAGQGGYGIQTAPAMGRLAAALLLQQPLPGDLLREGLAASDMSPSRLPRATLPIGS